MSHHSDVLDGDVRDEGDEVGMSGEVFSPSWRKFYLVASHYSIRYSCYNIHPDCGSVVCSI